MPPFKQLQEPIGDDLLTGVDEIAAYLKKPRRQTYYLLEKGHVPAFKLGNIWHSLKSAIRADIERRIGTAT
jgi:hypothetical protein